MALTWRRQGEYLEQEGDACAGLDELDAELDDMVAIQVQHQPGHKSPQLLRNAHLGGQRQHLRGTEPGLNMR